MHLMFLQGGGPGYGWEEIVANAGAMLIGWLGAELRNRQKERRSKKSISKEKAYREISKADARGVHPGTDADRTGERSRNTRGLPEN